VGVNWDGDKGELSIAGVVYRPGDEEFLQTMVSSERKAGMFEKVVKLPPQGVEKEEIDGLAISARMEDGVLIVTVPKLEKEWTEVRKVDIE
jgi:HSP20 family protein